MNKEVIAADTVMYTDRFNCSQSYTHLNTHTHPHTQTPTHPHTHTHTRTDNFVASSSEKA